MARSDDFPSAYREKLKEVVEDAVERWRDRDPRIQDPEVWLRDATNNTLRCLADSAVDMIDDWLNPPGNLIFE
ncbi:MAG: hypothetical protein ACRETL_10490, partial [Gammaproteobacteria bacterium]